MFARYRRRVLGRPNVSAGCRVAGWSGEALNSTPVWNSSFSIAAQPVSQLAEFVERGTQQQKALLPLSRIKRVMRADDSVAMIGVGSKAFVLASTVRLLQRHKSAKIHVTFSLGVLCACNRNHFLPRQRRSPHHVQSMRVFHLGALCWLLASRARAEAPHAAEEGRRCCRFKHAPLQLSRSNHAYRVPRMPSLQPAFICAVHSRHGELQSHAPQEANPSRASAGGG